MKDLKYGTNEKRLQAVNAFPSCLWSTPDSTLRKQMMDALIRTLKIRDKRLRNAIHQAHIKTNKNLVYQPVREYLLNTLTILIQGEDPEAASLATNFFLEIYDQTGIIKDLKLQAWYCTQK